MMSFATIVLIVGVGLLILGGISSIALLSRALKPVSTTGNGETQLGTLWGLFLLGITLGLVLIYFALRSKAPAEHSAALTPLTHHAALL
jgi:uncharacterized BrkB/YihY/UPF0761 family membrane protein